MAKKNEVTVLDSKAPPVALFEINESEQALAAYLEVDLMASVEVQKQRVREDSRQGLRVEISMGLRLLAIKGQTDHGGFEDVLADLGVASRAAQKAMQTARAFASEGDARRREALLQMGKTKAVTLLAQAREVREEILDSAELLAEALEGTKREFEAQLNSLKKENERLVNEASTLTSKGLVEAQGHIISSKIPFQVSNVRRETAALYKQAELAIAALGDMPANLLALQDVANVQDWLEPTGNQIYTAMRSLHAALGTQLTSVREVLALNDPAGEFAITDTTYYQPEEAPYVAQHFAALALEFAAEGEKRKKQYANDEPGKRGRKLKVD